MPIIVIARGTLSGGQITAERVAQQLGLPALGRETLLEFASRMGAPGPRIARMLDTSPRFWDRFQESPEVLMAYMQAAMAEAAKDGELVYHGHYGQELLGGVGNILRVRIIAPVRYRIAAAMEEQQLSHDDAVVYIKRTDEDRLKRGRQLFGLDWTDPALYDLLINLDQMSEDMAADVIVHAVKFPKFQDRTELMRQIHDLALASNVRMALLANGWLVDVTAENGAIRLRGEVHLLPSDKLDDIAQVAYTVDGVKDVATEVAVVHVPPVATPY